MTAFWTYSAIVSTLLIVGTMAQRPSYAGSAPIGRPDLHSRFRDPDGSSTTPDLNNRLGQDSSTIRAPVDARGDQELVKRLNEWPRENRPFWLLNADAIEAARNQPPRPQQTTLPGRPVQEQPNSQQQPQFGTNLEDRNNFPSLEDGQLPAGQTIPIRPTHHRSSFLRPID